MHEPSADFVVVDTQVISWFTRRSPKGDMYDALLGGRRIALSFFVQTELEGANWGDQRRDRLAAFVQACLRLPVGPATGTWYNIANRKRRELRLGGRVDDTDLWIISHAAEYDLPLMTDDRGVATVAHHMGVHILTLQDFLDVDLDDAAPVRL